MKTFVATIGGILLIILFLTMPVHAQQTNTEITLQTDKEQVRPGEPLQLTITISSAETSRLPENLNLEGMEPFAIVGRAIATEVHTINGERTSRTIHTLTLIADKKGAYRIGPIQVEENNLATGTKKIIESNTAQVEVTDLAQNPQPQTTPLPTQPLQVGTTAPQFISLAPVRPTLPTQQEETNKITMRETLSSPHLRAAYYLLGVILFVALVHLIRRYLPKQNKKEKQKTTNQNTPPQSIQIPNLNSPTFYQEVKKRTLQYITTRYDITTEEKTTQEIIHLLEKQHPAKAEHLGTILNLCDKNRFSGSQKDKDLLIEELEKIK